MIYQPLIAADILETVIGAIFVILWLAGQLLSGRGEAKRKKKLPRPKQQPQPLDVAEGVPRQQHQGPRNQEEALRNEVEDFLRRAQGKPEKPQPIRLERQPPAVPMPSHNLRNEGVAEHVAKHLSTQEMAEHSDSLGETVALADDHLEARLHEKFDHDLGRLKHQEMATPSKRNTNDLAEEIAAMLRSPNDMKKLIVANEILRRPEW